jgi:group I intron endonuclease
MSHSNKSGIYEILCRASGKSYVGSSKSIYGRWRQHRISLRRGDNGCRLLQLAWNKYGEEAFHFSVIEVCDCSLLTEREQYYIDLLQPEYNIVKTLNGVRLEITHCPHGHIYDEKNTYYGRNGGKFCRKCNAERVFAIYAAETELERELRLARRKASHKANRAARLLKQKEYSEKHREEKREYDRQHRVEANERLKKARAKENSEKRELRLLRKRESYHRCKEFSP